MAYATDQILFVLAGLSVLALHYLLHNKTALYIRTAFLFRPNVVVTSVPFLLGSEPQGTRGPVTTGPYPLPNTPAGGAALGRRSDAP